MQFVSEAKLLPKDLAEIRWDREQKRQELKERPPEADFVGIHKDPVLKSRLTADLETICADNSNNLNPRDLDSMLDLWNQAGAKILPRQRAKPSPGWFELSRDMLQPAIERKRELLKDYYRKGKVETKAELAEMMRRKVAGLADAAKIRSMA